ncbi:MAG: MFS transporter, partial [Chloroflexota bacterium]
MRRLFAIRDARLLFFGQSLSLLGDTALFLALGIWVKTLTGSSAAAGLVFFFLALPALASPFGGLLVDRMRRRPLMIAVDLVIGTLVLLLLLVHGRDQLWLIYAVAVLYGASGVVFYPAQSALLTVMLPDDLLGDGNAVLQTVREGLRLVGPLLGAGLFSAFGGGFVAIVDGATFGLSAIFLSFIHVAEPQPRISESHFLKELSGGVRHVLRSRPLKDIIFSTALALLVVGFSETIIFAVVSQGLHRPPSFLGILLST